MTAETVTNTTSSCHPGPGRDHRRERAPMNRRSSRLRDAALDAAASGLYVFPCAVRAKSPAVAAWEQVATRDPDQINQWWDKAPYNIGAAVGRAGLVVIDLDDGRGEPAPEPFTGATGGRDVLAMLAARAGQPAPFDTWTVATPTGTGLHLYYRAPQGLAIQNSVGVLGWKSDVRTVGGYTVAPGSVLEQGYYRQINQRPIAELPGWLATALTPVPRPAPGRPDALELTGTRAGAYVRAIVDSEADAVAAAETGTRHHTRLKAARTLGRLVGGGELDEYDAYEAVRAAAHHHIGHDCTEAEVDQDLRDGLAYGRQLPRCVTRDGQAR